MSRLDDIKEQLKEAVGVTYDKLQENSTFNTLKEKFDVLPSAAQRTVVIGCGALLLVGVLSIPFSMLSEADEFKEDFQTTRNLIKQLLKAQGLGKGVSTASSLAANTLEQRAQSIVSSSNLIEEQIVAIAILPTTKPSSYVPDVNTLDSASVEIKLAKLNLSQLVAIGKKLHSIQESVKLAHLNVEAEKSMAGYFNVTYILKSFSLKQTSEEAKNNSSGRGKKREK